MIEFRLLTCPDKSQQTTYRHPGKELTMGNGEAEMVVDDPALGSVQVKIFWRGNGFLLENVNPKLEVRLNGKPISGPSPLKERDNVNMGRTTVNFTLLNTQPMLPPAAFEHPKAAERFVEGSKDKAILDALDFLFRAEAASSAPKPPPLPPGMPPIPRKP